MKLIFTWLLGVAIGVLATDFVAPPVKKIIYVVPIEDLASRVVLRCNSFYGRAVITVQPPIKEK